MINKIKNEWNPKGYKEETSNKLLYITAIILGILTSCISFFYGYKIFE